MTPNTMIMEPWGWIIVYAVGLTVLQLIMYRYLARQGETLSGSATTPRADRDDESRRRSRQGAHPPDRAPWLDQRRFASAERTDGGTAARRCPHCGTDNESERAFGRCWNCAKRIE